MCFGKVWIPDYGEREVRSKGRGMVMQQLSLWRDWMQTEMMGKERERERNIKSTT